MDVTIRFRATAEEKQLLEGGAKRAGLNLSEWMRGVLLSASGDVAHVEGSPEPEAHSALALHEALERKKASAPVAKQPLRLTVDEDKIAAFQRKAGMGGAGKK